MDVEWWKSFFEIGGVVLLFLTFAFGAGFMYTGQIVGDRQKERLREFDKNLTDAKRDLATQQERTAKAERETAQLKILARGRELTAEQSRQISASLVRFKGGHVFVSSYVGDAEAARLGLQIKAALEGAGIHVDDTMGSTFATPNNTGSVSFGIGVSVLPQQQELGIAIAKALRDDAHLVVSAKQMVIYSERSLRG